MKIATNAPPTFSFYFTILLPFYKFRRKSDEKPSKSFSFLTDISADFSLNIYFSFSFLFQTAFPQYTILQLSISSKLKERVTYNIDDHYLQILNSLTFRYFYIEGFDSKLLIKIHKYSHKYYNNILTQISIQMDSERFVKTISDKIICDLSIFTSEEPSIDCLIILNNQIQPTELSMLVKASKNIIAADGGANHLYESQCRNSEKLRTIIGDLDSAKTQVLTYYQQKGVQIQKVQNQDLNDFNKAINHSMSNGWNQIVCLGPFGDRMDQTLSSMSVTTNILRNNKNVQILLFGRYNLMFHLRPSQKYQIKIGQWISKEGCGLIPFGKVDYIQTSGFKWNLGKNEPFQSLEWGQFISTSNQIVENSVEVSSSHQVFFTSHFKK